jgi:hypothetical protein
MALVAALPGPAAPLPPDVLPLAAVRAGMQGWGLTVMKGSTPERFEVEVLGILPNTVGRTRILVKVSGLGLEKTGVIAGMSGSPIYLEGKLAGALSATWAFGKDAIGQVTPIENMLEIDAAPAAPRARATASSAAAWDALAAAHGLPSDERVLALERIAAPYRPPPGREAVSLLSPVAAGIPAATLSRFAEDLGRLGLSAPFLAAAGGAAAAGRVAEAGPVPARLVNGGALTAFLLDGDIQLGATGTVTRVDPDGSFVAFGHPFLGMGALELPVSTSDIVQVFPSSMMSFKLAAAHAPAYRLTSDRDPGISGRMDRVAPLVPVHFRLETGAGPAKELRWGAAPIPAVFPLLLAMSTDVALLLSDPTPAQKTVALRLSIGTKAGPFVYEDVLSGPRARDIAILTTIALAGLVADNEFEEPRISGVDISLANVTGERRFRVVDAGVAPRKVAPGQTLSATVRLAGRRGDEETRVMTLRVPPEAPDGRATLVIADGASASAARLALDPAPPRSLAGLRRSVERLLPGNRLVATLVTPSRGATTGAATLTALPPSAAAILAGGEGDSSHAAVSSRLLAEDILTLDRPVTGTIRLEVEIERPRS